MTLIEHERRTAQIQADNSQFLRELNMTLAEKIGRQERQISELEQENAGLKALLTKRILNTLNGPKG